MSRRGANFTSDELALVLSHYDLGTIYSAKALQAGNLRAPKRIIVSEKGKFLLKRRPHGKDDLYRVAFAHTLQKHLREHGFPVAKLIPTKNKKNSALNLNKHIYELFEFIPGKRYDQSQEATESAGRQLANFHLAVADFPTQFDPLKNTYHDSSTVRGNLKTILKAKNGTEKPALLAQLGETLTTLYNHASTNVNQFGFEGWATQIIHGDWHPGNMLFQEHKIVAVLDLDSVKISPKICDLANGMLHFSIVGGRPNPAEWPDYLDMDKLTSFFNGHERVSPTDKNMIMALPELMIETMIAEAVLPVAATGFFGHLSGEEFLKMILRKCKWINEHKAKILEQLSV